MRLNEATLRRIIRQSIKEQKHRLEMKAHIQDLWEYVEKTNDLIEVLKEANSEVSDGVTLTGTPTAAQRLQALKAMRTRDLDIETEFVFDDPDIETIPNISDSDVDALEVLALPDSTEFRDKATDISSRSGRLQVKISDKTAEKLAPIASGIIKMIPGVGIFGDLIGDLVAKKVLKPMLEKGLNNIDTLKAIEGLVKKGPMKRQALKAGQGFVQSLQYIEVLRNPERYSAQEIEKAKIRKEMLGKKNDIIAQRSYDYIKKNNVSDQALGERYLVLSIVNGLNQPSIQDLIKASSGLASLNPVKRKAAVKKIADLAMSPIKKTRQSNDNKRAEELVLDIEGLDDLYRIVAGVAVTTIEDDYVSDTLSITGDQAANVPLDSEGVDLPGMLHYSEINLDDLDPEDPTDAKIIDMMIKQLETERDGAMDPDVDITPGMSVSVSGYQPEDVSDGLKVIANTVKDTKQNVADVLNDIDDPEAYIVLPEPLSTEELLALAADGDTDAINALTQIYRQESARRQKVELPADEEIGEFELPEPEPEDPEAVPYAARIRRTSRPLSTIKR